MSELAHRFVHALDRAAEVEPGATASGLAHRFGVAGYLERMSAISPVQSRESDRLVARIRDQVLREASCELSAAFVRGAVPHFFFKGVALQAQRYYESGDRDTGDIDVIVPPAAAEQAIAILRELGYHIDHSEPVPDALRPGVTMVRHAPTGDIETAWIDVHWGLQSVNHVLPTSGDPVPPDVWAGLQSAGSLPVPALEHHAALLVHHLVHHDLLHVRGVLDLALLWRAMPAGAGEGTWAVARSLRVSQVALAIDAMLARDLGTPRLASGSAGGRRRETMVALAAWMRWAAIASARDYEMITIRRLRRRVRLVDGWWPLGSLLQDVLWPRREFLRWRWPEAPGTFAAWRRHVGVVLGNALSLRHARAAGRRRHPTERHDAV